MKAQCVVTVAMWLVGVSSACAPASERNEDAAGSERIGTLSASLVGYSPSGKGYRLRNAVFELTGTANIWLSGEDSVNAPLLEAQLPAGPYSLLLQEGWYLEHVTSTGPRPVAAELVSSNRRPIVIEADRRSQVGYRFRVEDEMVETDPGTLVLAIEIQENQAALRAPTNAQEVVVNEFMINPLQTDDAFGEWVELRNLTGSDFQLRGCSIRDTEGTHLITSSLLIPAQGYVVLGNSADPLANGGVPVDYQYGGLWLDDDTDAYALNCQGGDVTFHGYSGFSSLPAGRSFQLPGCQSSTPMANGDFGSPGRENPDCASGLRLSEQAPQASTTTAAP